MPTTVTHLQLHMTAIHSNLNEISIFLQKMKALNELHHQVSSESNSDLKKRPDFTIDRFPTHTHHATTHSYHHQQTPTTHLRRHPNLRALACSAIDSSFKKLLRNDDAHPKHECNSQTYKLLPHPPFLLSLRDLPHMS